MNRHATYDVVKVDDERRIIWIVDTTDGTMNLSVTNDAEHVVRELNCIRPGYRIIYKDTEGATDELVHEAGVFQGFKPARDMAL